MHPAYSIILFTAASGAGYGLLAAAGVYAALGLMPADRGLGLLVLCPALALVTAGLLSSTAHLGRPERAWRAFSQWRTSWLSREGVAALATYLAAAPFAAGWLLGGARAGRPAWPGCSRRPSRSRRSWRRR
jgi:DMSO reductase anchor subunit